MHSTSFDDQRPRRIAFTLGIGLLDVLFTAAMLIFAAVWLLQSFQLNLGPFHLTVKWGWKPVLVPILIFLARRGFVRAARGLIPPVRVIWDRPGARKVLLVLLDLLLLAGLILIPVVWVINPLQCAGRVMPFHVDWWLRPVLAPVVISIIRIIFKRGLFRVYPINRGLAEAPGFKKTCFALITTYIFFALFESILGWTKFNVTLPPIVFQGQNNAGGIEVPHTLPDPELLFRLEPGTYFQGRMINSLGFRDREVALRKQPGTVRVVCMGDSVTGQGRPGYSQYLHERLFKAPPTSNRWEAFNMGVHGYTSLQGLRLFQKMGRALEPDIVTLYYGWNEHWLAPEADRMKMGLEMRPFAGHIFESLRDKRFFRFFVWAMNPLQHLAHSEHGDTRVLRVAPAEYHSTLKAFIRAIRAAGAIPVLITAPRRSLTQEVVGKEYVISIEQGNRTHDEYADITRQVARESEAELLDLAVRMAGKDCDRFFARDGIHFDRYSHEGYMTNDPPAQPGLARIAEELDRKVREITRTPFWHTRNSTSQ